MITNKLDLIFVTLKPTVIMGVFEWKMKRDNIPLFSKNERQDKNYIIEHSSISGVTRLQFNNRFGDSITIRMDKVSTRVYLNSYSHYVKVKEMPSVYDNYKLNVILEVFEELIDLLIERAELKRKVIT